MALGTSIQCVSTAARSSFSAAVIATSTRRVVFTAAAVQGLSAREATGQGRSVRRRERCPLYELLALVLGERTMVH